MRRLLRQFAAGQFEGALSTAGRMLRDDPADPDAVGIAAACRARLESTHLRALGGRFSVFRLQASGPLLRALETDQRTLLMVTLVRRGSSLGEILDLHGGRRLDALLAIARLVEAWVLVRVSR